MKTKQLSDRPSTWAVIFDKGDEFAEGMLRFAREASLTAASFTAIGAFRDVTLGYFDREQRDYREIPVDEQVEVVSLVGDVARKGDDPKVHAHVVVARADGSASGGHVLRAHVWPTLEVVVTETPAYLRRTHDEETGLALIDLAASGEGPRHD